MLLGVSEREHEEAGGGGGVDGGVKTQQMKVF